MRYFYFFLFVVFYGIAQGQESYLNSDRPDQSEGTYVLTKGYWQFENGFLYLNDYHGYGAMFRYGLFSSTEIRLESSIEKQQNFGLNMSETTLSFKQFLYKGTTFLPEITLVGYLTYSSENESFTPNAAFAFSHSLSNALALDYNIALTGAAHDFFATAQLNYTFENNVIVFGEYFATFGNQAPKHSIDAGVLVPLSTNFQIDFSLGRNIFTTDENYFFSVGFSCILSKK